MSAASYAEGYQGGMKDIAQALADNGEEGVRTWLANNLTVYKGEQVKYIATWPVGVGNMIEFAEGYVLHAGDLVQARYLTKDGKDADPELTARLRAGMQGL